MGRKRPVSTVSLTVIGSQDHKIIQVGRDLRQFLVQHPAQSRVSCENTPYYCGLYPFGF